MKFRHLNTFQKKKKTKTIGASKLFDEKNDKKEKESEREREVNNKNNTYAKLKSILGGDSSISNSSMTV